MLTSEQVEFYELNGYLIIENALPPKQLAEMQAVTLDFMERSRSVTRSNDLYDLEEGHSVDSIRLTRIKLPHTRHPIYWDLLRSEHMSSMLTPILGLDIRLHTCKLNTKAPGGGAAVEWHQDWAFYPHTNDDMLAIGVMLGDIEPEDGPLMVIPGSHKGPTLDHSTNGVFCGAVDPDDPNFDFQKP